MSPDEQTASMLQVSQLLREPHLRDEYLLVAADLALYAKDRGSPGEIDSFMQLMITAAGQSALRAAFINAKRFLDGYESTSTYLPARLYLSSGVVERAGGLDNVLKTSRGDYFTYLKLVAEVYGVLKLTAEAEVKVSTRPQEQI